MQYPWKETLIRYGSLLMLGIVIAWTLTALNSPFKYPFENDSTGVIQEAEFWHAGQGLMRTASLTQLPQLFAPTTLFPPGYSLLVGSVILGGISADTAALWVSRFFWVLMPLAVAFALAPLTGFARAAVCGVLAALSPGAVENGYMAMTDVPFLVLVAFSLGLLARAQRMRRWVPAMLMAGLLSGTAYALRNAGAALLVAVVCAYVLAVLVRACSVKLAISHLVVWGLGVACMAVPLFWRNYLLFGQLQPYQNSEASFGYLQSLRIFISGLFMDMSGSKTIALLAWDFKLLLLAGVPMAAGLLYLALVQLRRAVPEQRFTILLLASYAVLASIIVIIAQKRYGVDGSVRYAMQSTWVMLGLAAYALFSKKKLFLLLTALLLAGRAVYLNDDLQREGYIAEAFASSPRFVDAAAVLPKDWILTNRIKYELARDSTLPSLVTHLPVDAVIVSNQDTFVQRLVRSRAIMHLELDSATDSKGFAAVAQIVAARAPGRPLYCLIVPTNRMLRGPSARDWERQIAQTAAGQFDVIEQHDNYQLLKLRDRFGAR
ncbi:hypothetical protein SFMTTN_1590 [Sulfuriferula multivorans]|uniref:Glycosyltransferase RgtA/B/C/D-like domain-containing protein n=1 Tax=Sulfuriferula multivorans TaxID=1559896 RepID=A0A401JDT7_9PROT|nr:hypothetical protein [Sulfuriferula multivorans]GBL45779.1 hypothetical protein SFMTTN_1590 [Sulfuriferula multivorans]